MDQKKIKNILTKVSEKSLSPEKAIKLFQNFNVEDLGFANLDHHRELRQGFPEVVFCEGKTPKQVITIFNALNRESPNTSILGTKASKDHFKAVNKSLPRSNYCDISHCIYIDRTDPKKQYGDVLFISAGTSDQAVIYEALYTAHLTGSKTELIQDVGVAGLQRIVRYHNRLLNANVIVVAAGMEAALPSVIAGMVGKPVIGLPTSVGYGSSYGGLSALLGILNSCASNLIPVNIDAGFKAGYISSLINRASSH